MLFWQVFAFLLLIVVSLPVNPSDEKYALLIDAGSSGTRAYLYKFSPVTNRPILLKNNDVNPGISSLKDSTGEIKEYLHNMLSPILQEVGEEKEKVEVSMFATAGLRLLSESKAQEILRLSYESLLSFGLFVNEANVRIITGYEEAVFSFLSVNLELNDKYPNVALSEIFGIVEMGGASMQIAFKADENTVENHIEDLVHVEVNNDSFYVFAKTFLGFGANEARKKFLESESQNVCKEGTSFETCSDHVKKLLNKSKKCLDEPCYFNGVHAPLKDLKDIKFVGLSDFYYSLRDLSFNRSRLSYSEFKALGKEVCETPFVVLKNKHPKLSKEKIEQLCFKATWELNVLFEGFEFSKHDDSTVEIINLSWTPGAAYYILNGGKISFEKIESPFFQPKPLLLCSLVFCAGLIGFRKNAKRYWTSLFQNRRNHVYRYNLI